MKTLAVNLTILLVIFGIGALLASLGVPIGGSEPM